MQNNWKRLKVLMIFMVVICGCFAGSSCKKEENYAYEKYENVAYGDYERQVFDLCLPKGCTTKVGLIFVIHGGGWAAGDKADCSKNLDKWCRNYGCATAAINYHYISNEFSCEDIISDITLSLNKIKEFVCEKNINIEKAMLVGSSAGGHLSLLYAYKYADIASIKPVAVVNYSGPTDLTDYNYYLNNQNRTWYLELFSHLCHTTFTLENYLTGPMQNKLLEYSPITYVNENTVPTLICHGDQDDIVPYSNAQSLKAKLNAYGVKSDFVSYEKAGHSLSGDKKHAKEAKKLFTSYVNIYLK